MDKLIEKYCAAKGLQREELMNGKRDKQSVLQRNAVMYALWLKLKPTVSHANPKSKVYEQIGAAFNDMKRHTVHEKIDLFETELSLYRGHKSLLEEIQEILG